MKTSLFPSKRRAAGALLILAAASLSACGNKAKEAKPGQALASVNGEEITVLQLNEELQRAGVGPAQQDAASKQLLQALIDRQLLQSEAAKEKLDRDPKVMQAVERAKSLIIAQAYMQKRLGTPARPTPAEIEDYYSKHPEFFSRRKQFNMNELIIASADLTPELKAAADNAKSLEELAVWLDAHKVKFGRTQVSRTTADLAPELSAKLMGMSKGQLFVVKEGERSMLISIAEIKDAPVTIEVASQQIEQYLMNKKTKDAAAAELARLRATAKIEYINKSMAVDPQAAPLPAAAPAPAPALSETAPATPADANAKAAIDRGVAGLK
ncbi:MAG TPA: EpsD family peptidyl-prolyl cis-trans isomerase [Telluria sp.]|nr:EpsD family peptidyl-prolyl cis-trans isomerase [Telluria sp.]